MTNENFCKIVTEMNGEEISHIDQMSFTGFNGEELKEFLELAIALYKTL